VAIEDQIVALTGKRDEGSQTVDATRKALHLDMGAV
jgi:hypothetical protein